MTETGAAAAPSGADAPPAVGSALAPLDLGDPRPERLIVRLALPSVIGLTITGLHHVANAVFIGMINAEAVVAVSIVFPLVIVVMAVGEGLGVGLAACIARYLGEDAPEKAHIAATTGIAMALSIGLAVTALVLPNLAALLVLFGATPATLPIAQGYATITLLGSSLMLLQMLCDFIAIAEGNTRFSMWTLLGSFTLNIVLDPLLIFGLDLGVEGAALATILAQVTALAAFALYFRHRIGRVRIAARHFVPTAAILRAILGIGVPVMLSTMLTAAALALVYVSAGRHGGDPAIAGIGIALRLLTMGLLPLAGFCLGAQPVLGYAHGAGDRRRVLRSLRFMLKLACGFTLGYALLILLMPGAIARLFTDEAEVAALAARALVAYHLCFALAVLQAVLVVLLQALDKPLKAALVSLGPVRV